MLRLARLALALSIAAAPAAAAAAQPEGGIKGGVTFANIPKLADLFEEASGLVLGEAADVGQRVGIAVGGYVAFNITNVFAIQPEVLYVQRGLSGDAPLGPGTFALELDYLDAALLVRLGASATGFKVLAGPSFNFNVRAVGTAENEDDEELGDEIEGLGMSIVTAAGYYGNAFIVEGRYEEGLTNVAAFEGVDDSFRHRVFMVLAGWRIR
jgi:hypothetical protein